MRQIEIKIDMEYSVFENREVTETAWILRELANAIENEYENKDTINNENKILINVYSSNGGIVGTFDLTEREGQL